MAEEKFEIKKLDENQLEALRQQLKAAACGSDEAFGELSYAGGHCSAAGSGHSSHCDADGWV